MAVQAETRRSPRPREKCCATCWFWHGDRAATDDDFRTGHCSVATGRAGPPPYFAKLLEAANVEPVTMAADLCAFHVYHHQDVGNR